jgi:hypothetical protein
MDNKPVDIGVGMHSEKIDMDKYNLEHMVEKEVSEEEREEEAVQKGRRGRIELELVDRLRNACSSLKR